ncbi:MAG TPA: RHS repeat-associated core domain-containing protein, partial [Flavisolibacter sp.]|nr:RHS repeat-associated core domain-containing protein [Flavisolibacter sp.]
QWDYFLKDHLGNVRMVVTEEEQSVPYPPASLETASLTTEKAYYGGLDGGRIHKSYVLGYPNDPYTSPNDVIQLLNGSGPKLGANMMLKVMAGDKINIRVSSWYQQNYSPPMSPVSPLTDLVTALSSGIAGVAGKVTATELSGNADFSSNVTQFLTSQGSYNSSRPKAFLNWILFDEQFKLVASSSGFDQVGGDGELKSHVFSNLPIHKNGYFYVYVSNETPHQEVAFDNLQVTHNKGPILEETHYYPFGLTMHGISTRSAFTLSSKKGYNGNELQNKEFADGSGLEVYDFNARTYDQQIGRFLQLDPMSEEGEQEGLTPYHFSGNNPSTFNDPNGKCPWCLGAVIGFAVEYGTQVATNLSKGQSLGEAMTDIKWGNVAASTIAGGISGGLSNVVPKGTTGKVLLEGVKLAVDAGESIAKQYNETGSVSLNKTVTDVASNVVAGKLTENVKINSNSTMKTAEKQLDRAKRIAQNDPTSSGRAATVNKLDSKVSTQKATNFAAEKAASGSTGNALQAVADAGANSVGTHAPIPNTTTSRSSVDNTAKRPIFY